jgi:hypothetical protein
MKGIQKITRVQLKISHEHEYIYIGLVSSEPDYKLSLIINKKFRISLRNSSPIKITDESGSEVSFSRFSDSGSSTGITFNLFSNRSGNNFLLKKLKNVDYILQIHDPENENNIDPFSSKLREIESVHAVFEIDLSIFKDKNLQYLIQ